MSASLATVSPPDFELISDEIVTKHMAEKHIPGMSVAIVQDAALIFSKGYGIDLPIDGRLDNRGVD